MKTTVLNENLLVFTRKYILREAKLTDGDSRDPQEAYKGVVSEFAEQLLLFDTVIIKLDRSSQPVSIIINQLGLEGAIECIENGSIRFLLCITSIFFGQKINNDPNFKNHPLFPFALGHYSSPEHCEPQEVIKSAFANVGYSYDRAKKRDFIVKAARATTIFKDSGSGTSLNFIIDAYKSNALVSLGVPYEKDMYDLEDNERGKIADLGSEILDIKFLSSNNVQSYNQYTAITLLGEAVSQINSAGKTHKVADEVYKLEDLPSFSQIFNHHRFDFHTLLKLRKQRESREFRKWVGNVVIDKNSGAISKEYLDFVSKKTNFFDSTKGKLTKDVMLFTAGEAIGSQVGLPATAGAILSKGMDFGFNFFTSLIFDRLVEGWNPRMFAENLRNMVKIKDE